MVVRVGIPGDKPFQFAEGILRSLHVRLSVTKKINKAVTSPDFSAWRNSQAVASGRTGRNPLLSMRRQGRQRQRPILELRSAVFPATRQHELAFQLFQGGTGPIRCTVGRDMHGGYPRGVNPSQCGRQNMDGRRGDNSIGFEANTFAGKQTTHRSRHLKSVPTLLRLEGAVPTQKYCKLMEIQKPGDFRGYQAAIGCEGEIDIQTVQAGHGPLDQRENQQGFTAGEVHHRTRIQDLRKKVQCPVQGCRVHVEWTMILTAITAGQVTTSRQDKGQEIQSQQCKKSPDSAGLATVWEGHPGTCYRPCPLA